MSPGRWETPALLAVLAIIGLASWIIMLRPALVVEASSLEAIPLEVGSWRGEDVPIQSKVEKMLDADFHVQRTYLHPTGGIVWFYVGYYGTERGGHPEHTPWVCYPSQGWRIERSSVVDLDRGGQRRANELLIEKDGDRRIVHFWYRSSRRDSMLRDVDQAVDRFLSRLLQGRADGSLIRLSTVVTHPGDEDRARSLLISFASMISPSIGEHWPEELESAETRASETALLH